MQGKVEICGVNTAKLPRLDSRETEALLARAKAGDRQAREQLISGNLRLVLSVIQKFTGRGENVDDLFQVGCVGLIKAMRAWEDYPHYVLHGKHYEVSPEACKQKIALLTEVLFFVASLPCAAK